MIIVTGASSGIGKQVALAASRRNEEMILVSRRDPKVPGAEWIPADFISCDEINSLCAQILARAKHVSMLVHCAGVMRSCSSKSIDVSLCLESYMVNVIAPLVITSRLTKVLARGSAKVVAISSIASMLDIPGEAIYSSTKSALDQGFNTLAADLSKLGISFLKIHPCMIDTPMTCGLSDDQKNYMHSQRSSKVQPSAEDLAEYIMTLPDSSRFISGSDILFGGIKR